MPSLPLLAPVHVPIAVTRRVQTPVVDLSRMTRYRGGTYSHTVDTIVFTDGTSARTDLIRLNPTSRPTRWISPGSPRPARRVTPRRTGRRCRSCRPGRMKLRSTGSCATRTRRCPRLHLISERLRAAGHPLGLRNITDHEAIAATQAAIWNLTNGLELDNRPLNVPVRTVVADGSALTVEFDGERQLAGFTAVVSPAGRRPGAAEVP